MSAGEIRWGAVSDTRAASSPTSAAAQAKACDYRNTAYFFFVNFSGVSLKASRHPEQHT